MLVKAVFHQFVFCSLQFFFLDSIRSTTVSYVFVIWVYVRWGFIKGYPFFIEAHKQYSAIRTPALRPIAMRIHTLLTRWSSVNSSNICWWYYERAFEMKHEQIAIDILQVPLFIVFTFLLHSAMRKKNTLSIYESVCCVSMLSMVPFCCCVLWKTECVIFQPFDFGDGVAFFFSIDCYWRFFPLLMSPGSCALLLLKLWFIFSLLFFSFSVVFHVYVKRILFLGRCWFNIWITLISFRYVYVCNFSSIGRRRVQDNSEWVDECYCCHCFYCWYCIWQATEKKTVDA